MMMEQSYEMQTQGALGGMIPAIASGVAVHASSEHDPTHGPSRCRLNYNSARVGSNAWCAAACDMNQYLQISVIEPKIWHGLAIQGRNACQQWVTSFYIAYSLEGTDWKLAQEAKKFTGNNDCDTIVYHTFPPFMARCIQIRPITWNGHISLRAEVYYDPETVLSQELVSLKRIPAIASGALVSSSSEYDASHSVNRCRLNFRGAREGANAWCAAVNDTNQYLQISTGALRRWVSVSTQGRFGCPQWMTNYVVAYTLNGVDWKLVDEGRVFNGNTDENTIVAQEFLNSPIALALQIRPISWHGHVSMRVEAYYRYC